MLIGAAGKARAELLARSLTRYRLVFVQLGCAFDPIRRELLQQLGGASLSVKQLAEWPALPTSTSRVIVHDLEAAGSASAVSLGAVREIVGAILDSGKAVALVSRSPRISYLSVAGSSVLEDAALVTLPLLSSEEAPAPTVASRRTAGWRLPSVTFGQPLSEATYQDVLQEVGQTVVAALDHALFEVNPRTAEGLKFLSPREIEALRCAGLVELDEQNDAILADPSSTKILRAALSAHISNTVQPTDVLSDVTLGLWFIERKVRGSVRAAAVAKFDSNWRASVLGGLAPEVLRRAQLDANVSAKSVADLRDPLEWLTLGELMDIIDSNKVGDLGVERAIWRQFRERLLPIRNRVAHVRMLKSGDDETVAMWVSLTRGRLG